MVLIKTSENGLVFPKSARPSRALLADFDIDGATLKKHHKQWLRENVIDPARAKRSTPGGWTIGLVGRASKSGTDSYNLWLSEQRLRAVESFLALQSDGIPFHFVRVPLGESSPNATSEFEHEQDRSVDVVAVFLPVKPRMPAKPGRLIPRIHIWKPRPNRKVMDFTFQVLKAEIVIHTIDVKFPFMSVGHGPLRVKMLIRIRELGSSDQALYEFSSVGGNGTIIAAKFSLKTALPGGGISSWKATYEKGAIHSFATDVEMDAGDFAGPGLFQFNMIGRTLSFGPKPGFFGSQEKIRNLSFGLTADINPLSEAEGITMGDMAVVESVPTW